MYEKMIFIRILDLITLNHKCLLTNFANCIQYKRIVLGCCISYKLQRYNSALVIIMFYRYKNKYFCLNI